MKSEPRFTANIHRVLAAIMSSPSRELAGAELIKMTRLMSGTLYPLLLKLVAAGWLTTRWDTEPVSGRGRPRRRYYSVSAKGAAHVRAYERELLKLSPTLGLKEQPQ